MSIQIETFDEASRIGIEPTGPAWPDRNVVGSSLVYGSPALEGPGELMQTAHGAGLSPTACIRGPFLGGGVLLTLPANARTTLRIPVRLAAPPWRGTDYTPRFVASFPDAPPNFVRLRAPAFRVVGPRGVHIRLASEPARRRDRIVHVKTRDSVRVFGTTDPVVRRARIWIGYVRAPDTHGEGHKATIARVRTDRRGRFSLKWSPRRAGDYQLIAKYVASRGSVVSDRTCGLAVRAR